MSVKFVTKYRVLPSVIFVLKVYVLPIMLTTNLPERLRIVLSLGYNARNGQFLPNKTIARSATNTTRNLTQPTELAEDWAGIHYTKPHLRPDGGIPIGAFCVNRTGLRSLVKGPVPALPGFIIGTIDE